MSATDGSRQFRALMRRLKPLADSGLGDSFADFARRLDIRPRKPSHLIGTTAIWKDVRLGRISSPTTVIAMFEARPCVLVYSARLGLSEQTARKNFDAMFGNCEVHPSPSGKGWWLAYKPAAFNGARLVATFDPSPKGTTLAPFTCAIIYGPQTPNPTPARTG